MLNFAGIMGREKVFKFKQFAVLNDRTAMKVGTDGVLLGAWADVRPGCSVLDIGTGTGLVALMAAQRGAGRVTAIEIDTAAAAQATRNAAGSEWADRIEVVTADVADYKSDTPFDRILSNPPYFRDSLRSPENIRAERILAKLSSEERRFLELRYVLGLSNEQIGRVTGTTAAAVSQKYHRLLAKCRKIDKDASDDAP